MQIFPSPHDDFTRSFFGVAHGTALLRREGQRIGGAVTIIVRREYNCLGEFPTNQVKKLKTGPARPSASHFKLRRASKRRPSPPLPALPLARFVEIARRLSPAWALASRRPLRVLGFEQGLPQCTAQPWRHLEHAQRPLFLPPQPPTSPGLSRRRQPRLRACPGPTLLRARAGSGICQGTQAPASAPPRRPWPSPPPFAAAAASEASFEPHRYPTARLSKSGAQAVRVGTSRRVTQSGAQAVRVGPSRRVTQSGAQAVRVGPSAPAGRRSAFRVSSRPAGAAGRKSCIPASESSARPARCGGGRASTAPKSPRRARATRTEGRAAVSGSESRGLGRHKLGPAEDARTAASARPRGQHGVSHGLSSHAFSNRFKLPSRPRPARPDSAAIPVPRSVGDAGARAGRAV